VFELVDKGDSTITFSLKSDAESKKIYPFDFELQIGFELIENSLTTRYKVINPSNKNALYFSIGAHPGFNVALNNAGELEELELHFEEAELLERHLLDLGLVSGQTELMAPSPQQKLALNHGVFETDAIIFKSLNSKEMTLLQKGKEILSVRFDGFPFMGVWTKAGAPYVCLEPWCGLADNKTGQDDIRTKEGIESLEAKKEFNRSFTISTPL
jgi:galactose mutarotase-like enzyme